MASLQQRAGWFHLLFRFQGKQYSHALKTKDRREAEAHRGTADRVLIRLRHRELTPPSAADLPAFLLAGGRLADTAPADEGPPLTIAGLRDRYLAAHAGGALEPKTLVMAGVHFRHLVRHFGERAAVAGLTTARVQEYLAARLIAGRGKKGRPLAPVTVQKEIAGLRACCNYAVRAGLLAATPFTVRGLVYPKGEETPPFQTRAEIERVLARGGHTPAEVDALWAGLFLTREEVDAFLAFACARPAPPHLFPMLAAAAHTGARRSELLRMRAADLDLDAGYATVRERKKARGQRTTRRVPVSGFLAGVLRGWLGRHPGGPLLFPHADGAAVPPTIAYEQFRRLVSGSEWDVLRGYHVLRHSFISICAARGVDERVLRSWVGHLSAATHRRYCHRIPTHERAVLAGVFG